MSSINRGRPEISERQASPGPSGPDSQTERAGPALAGCTGLARGTGGAIGGWSPPDLPADTALKRMVDHIRFRHCWSTAAYIAAIAGLLSLAPHLSIRAGLAADGLAALAAGGQCGLNFWRCRHAHCLVTATGWLPLSVLAFAGAWLGHSVIGGDEQAVFLAVLAAALAFEGLWYLARGTNSITRSPGSAAQAR